MNFHAMPNAHTRIKRNVRMDPAIFSNPATRCYHGVRPNLCPRADMRILPNHRKWPNANIRSETRQSRHHSSWMYTYRNRRALQQHRRRLRERHLRHLAAQHGFPGKRHAFTRHNANCLGLDCSLQVFHPIHINQILNSRPFRRRHSYNFCRHVAFHSRLNRQRQFPRRMLHRSLRSLCGPSATSVVKPFSSLLRTNSKTDTTPAHPSAASSSARESTPTVPDVSAQFPQSPSQISACSPPHRALCLPCAPTPPEARSATYTFLNSHPNMRTPAPLPRPYATPHARSPWSCKPVSRKNPQTLLHRA